MLQFIVGRLSLLHFNICGESIGVLNSSQLMKKYMDLPMAIR